MSTLAILESFSSMENAHVVDEPDVSLHHPGSNLVLLDNKVYGVESFCLGFREAWDALRA